MTENLKVRPKGKGDNKKSAFEGKARARTHTHTQNAFIIRFCTRVAHTHTHTHTWHNVTQSRIRRQESRAVQTSCCPRIYLNKVQLSFGFNVLAWRHGDLASARVFHRFICLLVLGLAVIFILATRFASLHCNTANWSTGSLTKYRNRVTSSEVSFQPKRSAANANAVMWVHCCSDKYWDCLLEIFVGTFNICALNTDTVVWLTAS